LGERREKIDHLDAGLKNGSRRAPVREGRSRSVDWRPRHRFREWGPIVAHVACHVEKAAKNGISDGNSDRTSSGTHRYSALKPGGPLKRHSPNRGFIEMRLHLNNQQGGQIPFDHQRFIDLGEVPGVEDDVHNRSANGKNLPLHLFRFSRHEGNGLLSVVCAASLKLEWRAPDFAD
jgi:hypothetical protein